MPRGGGGLICMELAGAASVSDKVGTLAPERPTLAVKAVVAGETDGDVNDFNRGAAMANTSSSGSSSTPTDRH
jgi:hypothetical protein